MFNVFLGFRVFVTYSDIFVSKVQFVFVQFLNYL